jgi:hypothetical protein
MKKKCRYACNRFFLWGMLLGLIMAWFSYTAFCDGETGLGIGLTVFTIIVLSIPIILMPVTYRFDPIGVTFCYLLLPNERYLWERIRSIEVDYDHRGPTSFKLEGGLEGKDHFYTDGKITKTWRTKYLLEIYWKGTITGYFFDRSRKKSRRRKHR